MFIHITLSSAPQADIRIGVAGISEGGCAAEDEFREITHNTGYYAVQGHSRSPILVPMHVCDFLYVHIIVTDVLSCTFPRYDGLLSNFRCRKGVPLFSAIVPAASPKFSIANLVSRN